MSKSCRNQNAPHLLLLPSFYPTCDEPIVGSFFQEHALALKAKDVNMGVIYPEIRPIKGLSWPLLKKNFFQKSRQIENGLPTLRMHGWNLCPGFLRGTMKLWIHSALKLYQSYSSHYGIPDGIHAQSSLWGGVAAHAIFKKHKIPYILTEHRDNFLHEGLISESTPAWLSTILAAVFKEAASITAVSHALEQGIKKYMPASSKEITVIPNFVDTDIFFFHERPMTHEPFTYLTVAHLMKSKNIDLLLRAFQRLIKINRHIKLRIVGDGPEYQALRQKAFDLNISGFVEFSGAMNRKKIRKAFATSHAFVLPSDYETFGIVFIEALAMGLPVIGTRCGGPEEIINSETGLLIECNNVDQLIQAMQSIKKNHANYNPTYLRKYAEERFGKSRIAQEWLNLYRSTLSL